jgi:2-phosphosulfolactate phosphatase
MKTIEVCLTPDMLRYHDLSNKTVVVIDIFRATSCIVTALAHGVQSILPVATVAEAKLLQAKGYLTAAERQGSKVEGFDLDNSPFSYLKPELKGKTIGLTTSNGTQAIRSAQDAGAYEVLIGSFLNIQALLQYLQKSADAICLLCAGWKGKVNLEDSFFAGAVLAGLPEFTSMNDDCVLALSTYERGLDNPVRFLESSAHYHRLETLGNRDDITFCLQRSIYHNVPVLRGDELVNM